MITEDELFRIGSQEKTWNKYCGFLDLTLPEFMDIQQQLLMKQIEVVSDSPLARRFMPERPRNMSEFRQLVPLTTYDDYADTLGVKNEELLTAKPYCWACTSGRGGTSKWVPYTQRAIEVYAMYTAAVAILACTTKKGNVNIRSGFRVLHNLPASPYLSGIMSELLAPQLGARLIPPQENYSNTDFEKKIEDGFKMTLRTGADMLSSMTSVLVRMGERFTESSGQMKFNRRMLQPQILSRLVLAWLRSKAAGRGMLPKDLWSFKGLVCYGMDTSIYKERIKYYWGKYPMELYGATEAGLLATNAWNKRYLTFVPSFCFLEFIPEDEWLKNRQDKKYRPGTVLLDDLRTGQLYEIIITNYHGMPFLRYRLGDLLRCVALEDDEAGIKLPQMAFESRADDLIDIAGFTRLDEKTMWQAIVNTGVRFEDWSARKENEDGKPIIHLYLELKGTESSGLEKTIHEQLLKLSKDYLHLETMLGIRPLKVTVIPSGSFQRYYEERKKEGADMAHLKPPHMNASDKVISSLLGTVAEAR
ncbi:MAG: hypothetical protein A2Z29_01810 [Chloroflexi bacterium RBG_16_56_11]|nr:MAG: hypothetical protein A2Z29_01810 [Chloroflexi bacterium RBG_16_56_11]